MSTGRVHNIPTHNKTSDAFIEALEIVIRFYERYGFRVEVVRSDSENNLLSDKVDKFLASQQIVSEHSAPYRHHQNGAERYIQTILKGTSTILHAQPWLRADMWVYALQAFTNAYNNTPNKKSGSKTPDFLITKQPVELDRTFLFSFGDFVVSGLPKEQRTWKFDVRNTLCIYLGQPTGAVDSHLIYEPYSHKVIERGSVTKIDISDLDYLRHYGNRFNMREGSTSYQVIDDAIYDFSLDLTSLDTVTAAIPTQSNSDDEQDQQSQQLHPQTISKSLQRSLDIDDDDEGIELEKAKIPSVLDGRSKLKKRRPRSRRDWTQLVPPLERELRPRDRLVAAAGALVASCYLYVDNEPITLAAFAARKVRSPDNPTLKTALAGRDRDKWVTAIQKEFDALSKDTLKAIAKQDMAERYHKIRSITQLVAKRSATNGDIDKFKARICARGDQLKGVLDAEHTYSPTIFLLTFAVIFHLAIILKMKRRIIDTVAAYLYQRYPTEADRIPLYITLEQLVGEVCGFEPDQVFQVMMYIYGLPDAGKAYYAAVSALLIRNGYVISKLDPCLFYRISPDETTYITLHVDDAFVCSTTDAGLDRVADTMRQDFQITVNDNADAYLGIHLESLPDGSIKLTQPKLLRSLFQEFKPENYQHTKQRIPTPTRGRSSSHSSANNSDNDSSSSHRDLTPCDILRYLHLLGALMYITRSRPDVLTATSFGSTKSKSPTVADYEDLLHIVYYLYITREKGLILRTAATNNSSIPFKLQLNCYVDASYLIHSDSKSHTGYTMSFGDLGNFHSKSSKQQLVATSSTHAEMRALYSLVIDIIFVLALCAEIAQPVALPAIIHEDNQPVITLVMTNSTGIKKCKHFQMIIAYIKEQVELGLISVQKIDTTINIADNLSKPTYGQDFAYKAQMHLGRDVNEIEIQPVQSNKRNREEEL